MMFSETFEGLFAYGSEWLAARPKPADLAIFIPRLIRLLPRILRIHLKSRRGRPPPPDGPVRPAHRAEKQRRLRKADNTSPAGDRPGDDVEWSPVIRAS
jgi:hypothetical protein